MAGPKGDAATMAARQARLLELLADGLTTAQAAPILRGEGFPASHDTVENDVEFLRGDWQKRNAEAFPLANFNMLLKLQDLEAMTSDPSIRPERKIQLLHDLLRTEIELRGAMPPKRSESTNLNVNLDAVDPATLPEYRRWLHETRFMDAAAKEKAFQLIRSSGLNVRIAATIDVPTSSPLWNEQQKQIEEGDDGTD
jgi:hypothetical protein